MAALHAVKLTAVAIAHIIHLGRVFGLRPLLFDDGSDNVYFPMFLIFELLLDKFIIKLKYLKY